MQQAQQSEYAPRVIKRYQDAYLVARATNGIGSAVKTIGIILGVIIALAGIAIGLNSKLVFIIGGLILGAVVAIPLFVLGVFVAAHGQVLKATLDEAVHTSPFLTDDERATTMSLSSEHENEESKNEINWSWF